jgi:hypothetical protein
MKRRTWGVLCFGIGLAFSVGTIDTLIRPDPRDLFSASTCAFFAGVFLLGSLFLLRAQGDARTDAVGNEEQGRNQEKKGNRQTLVTRLTWGPNRQTVVARLTWGLIAAALLAWAWFNAR